MFDETDSALDENADKNKKDKEKPYDPVQHLFQSAHAKEYPPMLEAFGNSR